MNPADAEGVKRARKMYVESDTVTLAQCSKAVGVSLRTIQRRSQYEHWQELRRERQQMDMEAEAEARRQQAKLAAQAQAEARVKFLDGALEQLESVDERLRDPSLEPLDLHRLISARKMLQEQAWASFGLPRVIDAAATVRPASVVYIPEAAEPELGDLPDEGVVEDDPAGDGEDAGDDVDQ